MVGSSLTEGMIEAGRKLLERLDVNYFVRSAFWFYTGQEWRLIFSPHEIIFSGPLEIYRKTERAIKLMGLEEKGLSFSDIVLAEPRHPIVKAIGSAVHTGPRTVGIRFSDNVVNGIRVQDAYIYRSNTK